MKKNAVLLLEYDGSRYGGWQRQKGEDNTIQGKLETVLEKMTGTFQEVHGSGRTDAGVHALGQVANVHLDTELSEEEVAAYLNHYLPDDIRVLEIKWAKERFHSRLWAREDLYLLGGDRDEKSGVSETISLCSGGAAGQKSHGAGRRAALRYPRFQQLLH